MDGMGFDCVQLFVDRGLVHDPFQIALFPFHALSASSCTSEYPAHMGLCNPCVHGGHHSIVGHNNLPDKDPILNKTLGFWQDTFDVDPLCRNLGYVQSHSMPVQL